MAPEGLKLIKPKVAGSIPARPTFPDVAQAPGERTRVGRPDVGLAVDHKLLDQQSQRRYRRTGPHGNRRVIAGEQRLVGR